MKRILMLDDSEMILDLAREALGEAGYDVTTANDLASFEAAMQNPPDLIVMDVNMPEAFGDDVGMVMRGVRGAAMPIYLFSTLPDEELAARAKEAELDGWISKRAGIEAFVTRVREILG